MKDAGAGSIRLRGPDGWFFRAIKAAARGPFWFTVVLRRRWLRLRGENRWKLAGECRRCSACCERPSIQLDRLTWNLYWSRKIFLWWQSLVNGFELVATEKPRVLVFRCRYFDEANRRCTSYESRPGICRDYPRFLLEQPWPELLTGCGYRTIDRRGAGILVALGRAGLTPEQQAALSDRLRLK